MVKFCTTRVNFVLFTSHSKKVVAEKNRQRSKFSSSNLTKDANPTSMHFLIFGLSSKLTSVEGSIAAVDKDKKSKKIGLVKGRFILEMFP